ncbi:MAG: class B sortase, partial [Eubacterium sp.]|nr:class B sortase [Eubacterium sp.]
MALQWTTEEHTLSNIKKGIADGWRMNEQQLYEYGRKLIRARERLFPGELGNAFAETVIRSAKDRSEISWPGLSKDVETIQKLLQGGMEWSREEWLVRLPLLERRRETCFYTVLGDAFIQTLKRKLGLCEAAQRTQISSENNRKQTVCDNIICETVQRTQISSENNRKQTVCDDTLRLEELASWLMEETDCIQTEAGKKLFRYFGKLTDAAAVVLAGLSLCFLSIWLYGRFEGNQNFYDIQKLKAVSADRQEALTENDSEIEKTAAEDQKEQDADDYSAPQTAANRGKTRIAGTAAGKQETADVSKKKKRPQILPQYREMAKEYPGLFGWLRIPDTRIDLPVMQPLKEKDFYLDHDFTGAASAEGALFADPENNRWPQDGNTVIY